MFRGQHRPGINTSGSCTEEPPSGSKDGAQGLLRDDGDLPDELELIIIQASPNIGIELRQDLQRLGRSEEHTSELQSRRELVCRLLLEKKKNKNSTHCLPLTSVT